MYIEASWKDRGAKARLERSGLNLKSGRCLTFYYHMHGNNVGSLSVLTGQTRIFHKEGNEGNQWVKVTKRLDSLSDTVRMFRIRLTVVQVWSWLRTGHV